MEVSPWIYKQNFIKEIEITDDNLDDYVVQYIYDEYTREEVLKGVKYLYGKRFNKR
jgi:predicted HAD superfamily hydrolase